MLIKLKHSKMFHSGVRVIASDNWDEMFQQGHLSAFCIVDKEHSFQNIWQYIKTFLFVTNQLVK
jgi:hypothetical protein